MGKFLLFVGGLVALLIFFVSIGPMILFAISLLLLYIIFKQFMKTDSMLVKVAWIVLGLIVLSFGIAHIYALAGILAAYVLYLIIKRWNKDKHKNRRPDIIDHDDPTIHFNR